ncbi:MAG: hypothetical protein KC417_10500 [Myxococcales bacterium]|nr:hypothetical protein [Myxococcales bacterium]
MNQSTTIHPSLRFLFLLAVIGCGDSKLASTDGGADAQENADGDVIGDDGAASDGGDATGCVASGAIGLQATPGFKSALEALSPMGNVNLAGETLSGKHITGSVRGYGTIKDSWIEPETFVAVQNDSSHPLVLEDVTIGGPATYGDLAVASYGSGGIVLRRVSAEGYADCFRDGPFDIENTSCVTTLQSQEDHNDGYQAYMSGQVDVKIRCSEISSIGTSNTNGGIFHADGSQEHFTLQNLKIRVNHNYCIRLHSASKYGELPSGDTVDDGRVLRMEIIDCAGGPVWIDGLPVDFWSNVMVNGKLVSGP